MKVYFSGAHSTGKSTLARYCAEKYDLPLLTEVARSILSEKELQVDSLRSDLNVVDDYQRSIFHRQLAEENKLNQGFVADRSIIDCLSYSAQHSRILPELLSSPELLYYKAKLKVPDSILFFVRPSKATLASDGVREALNWDGIISIDAQIKFILQMWEIPHFQINMDSLQERAIFIDNVLKLHKQ